MAQSFGGCDHIHTLKQDAYMDMNEVYLRTLGQPKYNKSGHLGSYCYTYLDVDGWNNNENR